MSVKALSYVIQSLPGTGARRRPLVLVTLGSVLCLASLSGAIARADTPSALPILPGHSVYPSGVKVKDHAQVTNVQMDCNWNADCTSGLSIFHQSTQESLGRVSGWMQRGKYQSNNKMIVFVTWGSTYSSDSSTNADGTPAGSQAAAADFASQLTQDGATTATCPAFPVAATQVACWTLRGDGSPGNPKSDRYWVIAWWSGTAEVEMAAYANTKYALVRTTFHTLAAQTMGGSTLASATPTASAPGAGAASDSAVRSPAPNIVRAMRTLALAAPMKA